MDAPDKRWLLGGATLTVAVLSLTMTAKSNTEEGQVLFNNACRTCHTMKEGDNRLGPHLNGIVGRKAAGAQGYAYSPSMQSADLTWDKAKLDEFIADPDAVIAGNNMKPFTGIKSAEDRAKIVEYLAAAKPPK